MRAAAKFIDSWPRNIQLNSYIRVLRRTERLRGRRRRGHQNCRAYRERSYRSTTHNDSISSV